MRGPVEIPANAKEQTFTVIKDPALKQLILKMQLFYSHCIFSFCVGCIASHALQTSNGRLRWLLFWKAELYFCLLSWRRRGDGKAPAQTHLSQLLWTFRRAGSNRGSICNNGREADDTRGGAHAGSRCASITGYELYPCFNLVFPSLLLFFLFVFCFWYCLQGFLRLSGISLKYFI